MHKCLFRNIYSSRNKKYKYCGPQVHSLLALLVQKYKYCARGRSCPEYASSASFCASICTFVPVKQVNRVPEYPSMTSWYIVPTVSKCVLYHSFLQIDIVV